MPYDIHTITDKQHDTIVNNKEWHLFDAKSKQISATKLSNTVSAFANADGGELFIGLEEPGAPLLPFIWEGFTQPEDANGHIQLFEELFPLGHDYTYDFLEHSGSPGYVLKILVKKTRGVVFPRDAIARIRRSAQNLRCDTEEKLTLLKRAKGIVSYETEIVPTDLARITNSETAVRFILDVVPSSEPEPWFRKNDLIRENQPTVAAIVLFDDLPQAVLPKHTGIKIYRYQTGDEEGARETLAGEPVSIEGCAYDLIKDAVHTTQQIIGELKILGPRGFQPANYPPETLHETITNAVLHRDYAIADDVHIRIFDDRVEVESPGRLPAHITPDNILKERYSRNGNIVRVINKFPNAPNKDIGEGLNTAVDKMREMRLTDPVFIERANAFIVQINHQSLESPANLVMEYLKNNAEITNRTARQLTGIKSENSMKGVFYRLQKKGLIEPVPGKTGFSSAWQKVQL